MTYTLLFGKNGFSLKEREKTKQIQIIKTKSMSNEFKILAFLPNVR